MGAGLWTTFLDFPNWRMTYAETGLCTTETGNVSRLLLENPVRILLPAPSENRTETVR